MPAVASAIATDLGQIDPAHAAYYKANSVSFIASLGAWDKAIATFKAAHPGTPVATAEPVADYLLQSVGADNMTPFTFQADIMNGVDPSPQDTAIEKALFTQHKVKVFLYNQQVTDSLTESFISLAHASGIPVVGVYETMPAPRVRLPVLDARRGERTEQGRDRRGLDGTPLRTGQAGPH
jgi:zinc/manganese transport system substrate-binding protein